MAVMTSRDARRVLDAVSELGGADSTGELRAATAKAAFDILPVDRAGWVSIDVASGELRGIHRPYQVDHLLAMIPRISRRCRSSDRCAPRTIRARCGSAMC